MLGWNAVQETNWGHLFHAYGVADDTPGHLRNLANEDAALRREAVDHLFSAVVHQGSIYSVTSVAVRVVSGMLAGPVLRRPPDNGPAALVAVLAFLNSVGRSLAGMEIPEPESAPQPTKEELDDLFRQIREDDSEDDKGWGSSLMDALMDRAVLELRAMAGEVLAAITPLVSDAAANVRWQAMDAAAQWGALQPDSARSAAAVEAIERRLDQTKGRDERAGLVLSLGKLGQNVSRWLDDADEAVRACAALFVHSGHVTSVLVEALTHPDRVNAWFANTPAFFRMHVRFRLLRELISRGVTIEEMLPAALALIARSGSGSGIASVAMDADAQWGPILRVAFPRDELELWARPPLPESLTDAQRAVLEALVANENLWNSPNGNANLARMSIGLPNDREEVANYCRNAPAA